MEKILVLLVLVIAAFVLFANGEQEAGVSSSMQVSAPGTFPIVDEKVTLTFFAPKSNQIEDLETNEFTKYYEKKTNVHIDWELAPQNAINEKKQLSLASGDYPDVFFGTGMSPDEQLRYGVNDGVFIVLNDLIKKYGLETKKMFAKVDYLKPSITAPDGNIYGLPSVNECFHCRTSQKLWINHVWLDRLGLEKPTTTEELYQVLKAFKEQDPNGNGIADEIPLSGATDSWHTNIDGFLMSAFTYNNGRGFTASDSTARLMVDDNGKVWAPYMTKDWQEGLRYIKKLYDEGLIDPTALTQQQPELQTLGENPGVAILGAVASGWFGVFSSLEGQNMKEYDALAPITGPKGFRTAGFYPYAFSHGEFVITDACATPDVAMRWADDLYNIDNTLRYVEAGRPGIEWREAKEGELDLEGKPAKWTRLETTYKYGEIQNVHYYQMGPSWRSAEYRRSWSQPQDEYDSNGYEKRLFMQSQAYEDAAPPWYYVYPKVFPVPADVDETAQLTTEVMDYLNESIARFITGDLDIEKDWSKYLAELKNVGIERLIELKQKAYDAQYAK